MTGRIAADGHVPPPTETLFESHWNEKSFRPLSDRCREAFERTSRVRSIAHFSNGIVDFVVRRADAPPQEAAETAGAETAGAETAGAETAGAETSRPGGPAAATSGTEPDRADSGGADSGGADPIAGEPGGTDSLAVDPTEADTGTDPFGTDPFEAVETEARPGRRLIPRVQDIDRSLRWLGLGELMRTVVATDSAGLYCGRVKAGQYLVGLTLRGEGVEELDETMNALVSRVRTEVYHLPDELLGGVAAPPPPEPDPGTPGPLFEPGLGLGPVPASRLRGLWHRTVNPVDLQYAAYYRGWSLVCAGDAFDSPELSPRFLDIAPVSRRALFRDVAGRLRRDVAGLRDVLRPLTGAPLTRLVLDVQEGALLLHWPGTGPGDFVLGATMDQFAVGAAEHRLRALVSGLPPVPGR